MQKIKLPDRRILVIIVVAVVAALALTVYLLRGSGKSAGFKTVQVKRGDLQAMISATGHGGAGGSRRYRGPSRRQDSDLWQR